MRFSRFIALATSLLFLCAACTGPAEDNGKDKKKGIVAFYCTTEAAADVTENSAVLKGSIYLKTDEAVSGSAWFYFGSDRETLKTQGQKVTAGSISSNIYTETTVNASVSVTGLQPNTTYYYLLEASVGGQDAAGNTVSFQTSASTTAK